jgi:hypothetical protein
MTVSHRSPFAKVLAGAGMLMLAPGVTGCFGKAESKRRAARTRDAVMPMGEG